MSPRQIGTALVLLAAALAGWYWGVHAPLTERIEAAARAHRTAATRAAEALELAQLQRRLDPYLQSPSTGQGLITRLEQMLASLELRDRLGQIRQSPPRRPADGSPPPKDSALVRLDRLDLRQLTQVLKALSGLERVVAAQRVEIRLQPGPGGALVVPEATLTLEMEELPVQ